MDTTQFPWFQIKDSNDDPPGPNESPLKVWWIPEVPGKGCQMFVPSPQMAGVALEVLALYDLFLYKEELRSPSDFSNAGGVVVWNKEGNEWEDFYDEETGEDFDEWWERNRVVIGWTSVPVTTGEQNGQD